MATTASPTADQLPNATPPSSAPEPTQRDVARARLGKTKDRIVHYFCRLQPRLFPGIMTFFMLAILLGLGTWQIHRLHWKNDLIRQIATTLNATPDDLRLKWPLQRDEWAALNYHPVTVQGHWLTVQRFKLAPRTYEGQVGYQLIMPLRLHDDQVILVDRGFVPDGTDLLPPSGNDLVTVTGIARVMENKKPFGMPDNNPERGQWVWPDLVAMAHETGFGHVAPVMVYEARDPGRDSYPIGGQLPLPLDNNHWHYAATWYALALILTGVYVMSMSPKQDKKSAADDKNKKAQDDAMSDPVARRGMYPEATD